MYTTVDQVIKATLAAQGYKTLHRYVLYLHFALEGLYDLKRDGGFNSVKSEKLKVNSRRAVEFPKDMLWFTRIGIPINGRILNFVPDKSISINKNDHEGARNPNSGSSLVAMPQDLEGFLTSTNIYFSGGISSRNSRIGNFIARRFRVNEDAREFQLDSGIDSQHIEIDYVTNVTTPNSETLISHHSAKPLQEWILYRDSRFKNGAAAAETLAAERIYLNALDDSIASQSDLTGTGIMDALSLGTRWTIDQ